MWVGEQVVAGPTPPDYTTIPEGYEPVALRRIVAVGVWVSWSFLTLVGDRPFARVHPSSSLDSSRRVLRQDPYHT